MEQTQITMCQKEIDRASQIHEEKRKIRAVEELDRMICHANKLAKTLHEFQNYHTEAALVIPHKSKDLNDLEVIRSTVDGDPEIAKTHYMIELNGYALEENGYTNTIQNAKQLLADLVLRFVHDMAMDEMDRRADEEHNTWCRQNDVDDIGVY